MKVGVNLINFGPGVGPDFFRRWAREIEGLGYHLIAISDHVAVTPDVAEQYPAPFYDPFTCLAWLSGLTQKVMLGTTVTIIPYRSPLEVARVGANLDQLSGGRFILGVGVGWAKQEFEALGIPFDRRGAITNEYLAAIKALWTNDVASFDGEYVSFHEVHSAPRPQQEPHPPVWVGGSSDAALRRAVRFGDAWHPINITTDWLSDTGLPRLREIADDEHLPVPALCPRIKLSITASPLEDDQRVAGQGTLDQIRKDLESLQEMGARYVLLDTYPDDPMSLPHDEPALDMLRTLAEKVLDLDAETTRST